jgi:hypothetical protein
LAEFAWSPAVSTVIDMGRIIINRREKKAEETSDHCIDTGMADI